MTDPAIGTVLGGKYVVEGILGRGGMGVVVAARHRELDQRVAIKCLLPEALRIPDVVERFAREARAAVKIQGEHVARVIDVGRFEDGTPFMVMEHLQGHDLAVELANRGSVSVIEAVRYVLETCEALAQAHAMRIVHRDLKPSNLFLAETPGRRPIIKVLDFGISKVVDPGRDSLTKTASVMGTAYYMSPEQLLSSKNLDERSDIWSLGVILYELLIGRPPFEGDTAPEIIAKIVQNAPMAPRARRPDLPPGVEAVILRCMRNSANDRFANVAELAGALAPFGARGDRESASAIARVLGAPPQRADASLEYASTESVPAVGPGAPGAASDPESGGTVRMQVPRPVFVPPAQTPPTLQRPEFVPASAQTPPTLQAGRAPAVATAHNLSVSSRDVAGRTGRRTGWIAVGFAAVVAVVGVAVVFVRGWPPSATRASSSESPTVSAAATTVPTEVVALSPLQSSAAASPPASVASAQTDPHHTWPTAAPGAAANRGAPAPSPPKSPPLPRAVASATPPPAHSAAAAPTSRNPLELTP